MHKDAHMKYIISSTIGLLIVVMSGIWLDNWYSSKHSEEFGLNDPIEISFKVIGSASKPVDYINLNVSVKKEGDDQAIVKQECDYAADTMVKELSGIAAIKIDPRGIEVDKVVDYDSKQSKISVIRSFGIRLDDVNNMENIIAKIVKINGCMIKSTEYYSNKVAEIRKMAVEDGKNKMDEHCKEIMQMYSGKRLDLYRIQIDDNNQWSGSGTGSMLLPPTLNENLQNAQIMKNVEVKIEYDVQVKLWK